MTQGPDTPNWLAWIAPIGAAIGGAFAIMRQLFVTNGRLRQILQGMEDRRETQRLQLHNENLENFRNLFSRLEKVEQSQARTEGILSGRYPRLER